ncbi:MAG: class I adenylate-forming enzyme family protein [Myxococcota bacterium]
MTVLDEIRTRARERPEAPALVADTAAGTERISYGALVERMEVGAKRLAAAGVGRGERCGLLASQGSGFVLEALSILATGACLVPISGDHAGATLERFAEQARLHHVVRETEEGFATTRRSRRTSLGEETDAAFRALAPAYLRFTSGTTSERKGVILSHERIVERLAAANQALAIGPDDRVLWLLPMAHHFVVSILLYLANGATVLLPASSLTRPVLELAGRERATVLYASPFHHHLLSKDTSGLPLAGLRLAISTAEGLRAEVAARFRERFGVALAQALGIIEVGLPVVNLEAAASKPTALGRPVPAYDVWLRAEDGSRLEGPGSPERTGEICIRGPGLFDAYLEPWTPAEQLVEPDGFRTGDQGWFDADGTLFLAGRRHSRISMAGMKFFAEEVEAVLARHPSVRECRVSARRHAQLGEIPVAEIVLDASVPEPKRGELLAHCRAELPTYKIPRELRFVATLERTVTGKVRR